MKASALAQRPNLTRPALAKPAITPAAAELAAALVTAQSMPAAQVRASTTLRVWRIAILIAAPLTAAWAAVALVGPEYTGIATVKVVPQESGEARSASITEGLGRQLTELVWTAPPAPAAPQAAAIFGAFGGTPQRTMRLEREGGSYQILVTSSSRTAVQQQLDWLGEQYRIQVLKPAEADSARLADERHKLETRITQWERDLSALGYRDSAAEPAAAPSKATESEFIVLESLRERFASARQELEQRRSTLAEEIRNRNELRLAPLPSTAAVAPAAREEAYAADRVLQEDTRHLTVQLMQLRSAILQVGDDSGAAMGEVLRISDDLSHILDSPDAANADPARRILFERIAEGAADVHTKAADFARNWSGKFDELRGRAADPRSQDLLDAHESLTRLQGDFNYALGRSLNSLRLRLQTLAEHTEDEARSHVLNAEAVRLFHELQAAQRRFAVASGALQARDNYLLNAALDTAKALSQRTSHVRQALDAELEGAALQQARSERQARLTQADAHIEDARGEIDTMFDSLSELHGALSEMLDRVPNMARADADRAAAARERARLEPLLADTRERVREIDAEGAQLVDPGLVQLAISLPGDYPDNRDRLLVAAAAGWLGTVALLLALSQARGDRYA